jgi:hypothetical protein
MTSHPRSYRRRSPFARHVLLLSVALGAWGCSSPPERRGGGDDVAGRVDEAARPGAGPAAPGAPPVAAAPPAGPLAGAPPASPPAGPAAPVGPAPTSLPIPPPNKAPGVIKWRDTADGGNATGVHDCDLGSQSAYAHYEAGTSPGAPQLHLVGVYEAAPGSPDVQVEVARSGPSVVVLSSYEAINWVVSVAPGATVERVIAYGYHASTVSAPAGTPVEVHSVEPGGEHLPDETFRWPSFKTADQVEIAEAATGRELSSFRGCYRGRSFRIDEAGEIAPPHPTGATTGRTMPAGCEPYGLESAACVSFEGGLVDAVGLDSGVACRGPSIQAYDLLPLADSIAWVGDYLYACDDERGIARISVLDGTVDVAPVNCRTVTSYGDALLAEVWLGVNDDDSFQEYMAFDGFASLARRKPYHVFGPGLGLSSLIGTDGDRAYAFWLSDPSYVTAASLPDFGAPQDFVLDGIESFIYGFDAIDGRLYVHPDFDLDNLESKLMIFDGQTGASQGKLTLVVEDGSPFVLLQGLDCAGRP